MIKSRITSLVSLGLVSLGALFLAGPGLAQDQSAPAATPAEQRQSHPQAEPNAGYQPVDAGSQDPLAPPYAPPTDYPDPAYPSQPPAPYTAPAPVTAGQEEGIPKDDVLTAAENVFGKGAEGLAKLIEDVFKDQGRPIAYIAGSEAGGAFVVGLRYGSGMMSHKIEGERKVYWTGPSAGFDVGADANKVFVLVYNLHDSQELFRRYPAAEGRAYLVGGFSASILRHRDVRLVPIRLGVGVRLGVNVGYMKFSEKSRWMPF